MNPDSNHRIKSSIFETVGVDLAGPLFGKHADKVWMSICICVVYRAVHLEFVSPLSTDDFLLSLKCFIVRRGRPSHLLEQRSQFQKYQ